MLSVAAAQSVIIERVQALAPANMPMAETLGLVLAEDVASDIDSPPFDKAMMDGYAVRVADLPGGQGTLAVGEEITAGATPKLSLTAGKAARIMTGAPIPVGADAVVQVERTIMVDNDRVQIADTGLVAGQNMLQRGREMKAGEVILRRGHLIRPQEIGVLAAAGRACVQAVPRPRVVVLPTGDELVEPDQKPGPGQIRNGNGPMLAAQVGRAGGIPVNLGIARDRLDSLQALIKQGLESDMLILSGGVSAGKLDLVPGVLRDVGVEPHFHKVEMKPGKPVFFGTRGSKVVFGLPGNPVSSFVCFELFVRLALELLRGSKTQCTHLPQVVLAEDFEYRTDRPTYYPARLVDEASGFRVRVVPWFGSPDLRALVDCNCLVLFPPGDQRRMAGQLFSVLRLPNHG